MWVCALWRWSIHRRAHKTPLRTSSNEYRTLTFYCTRLPLDVFLSKSTSAARMCVRARMCKPHLTDMHTHTRTRVSNILHTSPPRPKSERRRVRSATEVCPFLRFLDTRASVSRAIIGAHKSSAGEPQTNTQTHTQPARMQRTHNASVHLDHRHSAHPSACVCLFTDN